MSERYPHALVIPIPIATSHHTVNTRNAVGLAAVLLLSTLVVGCSPDKPAEKSVTAGTTAQQPMAGMSMAVTIPKGALYTESEMARGLDVLELLPSDKLSANELAAAKLVKFTDYNPQSQPKIVWPAAFPVVRSYLDQLVRDNGLSVARTTTISSALTAAEKQSGALRGKSLSKLATQVDADVKGAKDSARVSAMSAAIKALAAVSK